MASLCNDPGGKRRIVFVAPDGRRKTIRLGKVPKKTAEAVKFKVECLVAAKLSGHALDDETARWIAGLDDHLADKLVKAGLTPGGKSALTRLGSFLDNYIAKRTDVKGGTKLFYGHTRRNLVDFFGPDKPLREITKGDADDFQRYLIDEGLSASTTVKRRCSLAKTFMQAAVRHELLPRNPFEDFKGTVQGNREKMRFIDRETIQRVIEAAPDYEWRLLIALARYGGLRVPSEALSLEWSGVDWARGRMTVRSPKTEHHENGASRIVPLFPELRPYLEEAWEMAEEGATCVIERWRHAAEKTDAGWQNCNLRTQFLKIIKRAGVEPWCKPWQNLRASRESELVSRHPIHVATTWIGNSAAVAAKHYLMVGEHDFQAALTGAPKAARNAAQSTSELGSTDQNKKQQDPVIPEGYEVLPNCTTVQVGGTGFEPATSTV